MVFQLTRRSSTPTSPANQAEGGFSKFRSMVNEVMSSAKGAMANATARNREQETSQGIHPQSERPRYDEPMLLGANEFHHQLGLRGSGHNGNVNVQATHPGTTGRLTGQGGQSQQPARHVNPTPSTQWPKTLDGATGRTLGNTAAPMKESQHHVINGPRPKPSSRF